VRRVSDDAHLRPARDDDVEAVLALWRDADAEPSVGEDPETLGRLVARRDRPLIVAEAEGRVVGSVVAGWDGWRGSLYRLAVAPAWQRRGLALRLVRAAERRLREQGARKVHAIVVADRDPAVALWRAAGYEPDSRAARYVRRLEPE